MVRPELATQARALKPLYERELFGRHIFLYDHADREQLEALGDCGVAASDLPHAERATREVLSLPLYPEMSDEQVEYVIEKIKAFLDA